MKVMVSACLLGENCKYNGGNNYNQKVLDFVKDKEVIPVCPEVMGGLATPRVPAEIVGGRVMTKEGKDVDYEFRQGAKLVLERALEEKPEFVILQSRSPSCGIKQIYDGSFTGKRIDGQGVTAKLLEEQGFQLVDVEDL
ncbi:MAG: DUF523 domain-containing protein [Acetatifactor sp.]|nr:DUF523 domain-containing protein [Acetatifactor sp.]